jgi:hypothetical protein
MMRTADVAIASPRLGSFLQFGSVDLEGASSVWGIGGSPMVPNLDYRDDGEESSSAKRSRGSLWCQQCVAGYQRATAVLPVAAIQVCCANSLLCPVSVP